MAVQIINDMPDAEVHRGDPVQALLRELNAPTRAKASRLNGRAVCIAITVGLHAMVGLALLRMQMTSASEAPPEAIVASVIDTAPPPEQAPPDYVPPPMYVEYTLPTPQVAIEPEVITPTAVATNAISSGDAPTVVAPMVESVEYIRAVPPVYPRESQRRREYGTVLLRVLVDALGRPAQIQVERSSGYDRLDAAAREAVAKFLFRPYEVNGVKQPAQVLIPIGFDRRAS